MVLLGTLYFKFSISQNITFDNWQNFSKQELMPKEVKLQDSNNNVDLIKFKNRFYVVFRTAPTHFPSKKVRMYIVSSSDFKTWDYETTINTESDIREPRFAIWNDSLYCYCFVGGVNKYKFQPKLLITIATSGNKNWTAPVSINMDGFVPWRLRIKDSILYLSAYDGKNLYNRKHKSNLRLFQSKDARNFIPISAQPQVEKKGAEEGEFIFDKSGTLYTVVRLEGYGALIGKAHKDSIDKWKCAETKYKYDSSLLFEHNDEIYLISRRNLDGESNRSKKKIYNLVLYSLTETKKTLFKLKKKNLTLSFIMDLPSTGDCAFPAIEKINGTDYLVMNYSNDFTKKEKNWWRGQHDKTYIYWSIIHIK